MASTALNFAIGMMLLTSDGTQPQMSAMAQMQRMKWCTDYGVLAMRLISHKLSDRPPWTFQQAAEWAAAHAYGPNGEAFRSSEDNAAAYMALAAAAYFSPDPRAESAYSFPRWANQECLKGNLLSADSGDAPPAPPAPPRR